MTANRTRLAAALVVGALLAGCSGLLQNALPAAGGATSSSTGAPTTHVRSWMARGLKTRDLLYISNGNGTVNVYRYWQQTLVGVLTNFTKPAGECADLSGNVYILDSAAERIDEYAHGGEKTIHTIGDSPFIPSGCSVDASNGDLAIANSDYDSYTPGNIAIYAHGSGKPKFYQSTGDDHFIGCAYDDRGDLLISSELVYYYGFYYSFGFYYLPKHGTQLIHMDVPDPNSSSGWPYVEGVAWDGKYWVVESYGSLFRFTINIRAKYISETAVSGPYGDPNGPLAFYRKSAKSLVTQAVGASSEFSGKGDVNYWAYPAGGSPLHSISKDLDAPYGAAISLGSGT